MKLAILVVLVVGTAHADSLERTDKVIIFGRVVQMDLNELTLVASYTSPSGVDTKELKVPRSQVKKLEFNSTILNTGGTAGIGARPFDGSKAAPAPVSQDLAVLTDGHRQPCDGATIDTHQGLHCDKLSFPKGTVIRIFFATK